MATERVRFTLNGSTHELLRADVEARLAGVEPEVVRTYAVRVNDAWFPVKQAFEVAIGVPRSEFISHTARRHLAALGFEVHGETDSHTAERAAPAPRTASVASLVEIDRRSEDWHSEANVQSAAVTALAGDGWRILSVANTALKERGVDIIASRDGTTVGVEVKGFPSKDYADPARADEAKRTHPSTQAGHWYSQAVLAAMRLRGREPAWRSVIALPDFPRYRDLYAETSGSLDAAGIAVWWVGDDGSLSR
jgi:Holliday junction resolvase-like predicted endonuclease